MVLTVAWADFLREPLLPVSGTFLPGMCRFPLGRIFWSSAGLPALWGWFSAFSMHVLYWAPLLPYVWCPSTQKPLILASPENNKPLVLYQSKGRQLPTCVKSGKGRSIQLLLQQSFNWHLFLPSPPFLELPYVVNRQVFGGLQRKLVCFLTFLSTGLGCSFLSHLGHLPSGLLSGFQRFVAMTLPVLFVLVDQIIYCHFSGVSQGREVNALFNLLSYPEAWNEYFILCIIYAVCLDHFIIFWKSRWEMDIRSEFNAKIISRSIKRGYFPLGK